MPIQNRVDPYGDLHTTPERGTLTGNRGCLVDEHGKVVRHHTSSLWISCKVRYKDWRSPLNAPRRWTPLFFLDDAVALAAGHRPCGLCRRDEYRSYKSAVQASIGTNVPLLATDLNRMLAAERLSRGRGVMRAHDRKLWNNHIDQLPVGTVIVETQRPLLVLDDCLMEFNHGGWTSPQPKERLQVVQVLTPPTSVGALQNGFNPKLHLSCRIQALRCEPSDRR